MSSSAGEEIPRNMRILLVICRLANAEWCEQGVSHRMRYIASSYNIGAVDLDDFLIYDSVDDVDLSVKTVIARLTEYSRMRIPYLASVR